MTITMTDLAPARAIRRAGDWQDAIDYCVLTYDDCFLRRKRLVTAHNEGFLVDLPHTESLNHGDAFVLTDGQLIEVVAAKEPLLEVTGKDLVRLAWHIGNRNCPCQVQSDRLMIQTDHVIREMLLQLGATLREVSEPFIPEGGAYGHGRTHSHAY